MPPTKTKRVHISGMDRNFSDCGVQMTPIVALNLIVRSPPSIGNIILQINKANRPSGSPILKASRDSHVRIYIPRLDEAWGATGLRDWQSSYIEFDSDLTWDLPCGIWSPFEVFSMLKIVVLQVLA